MFQANTCKKVFCETVIEKNLLATREDGKKMYSVATAKQYEKEHGSACL